eukprot:140449-Chlamydomonas_euryale.AAC.1
MLYEQLLALLRRWRAERAARTAAAAAAAEAARTAEAACTGKAACTAAAACKAEAPCGGVESRRAGGEAAPNDDNATSVSRGSPSEAADVELSPLEIFCASALAKVGATVATYPMIVIKSRMQHTTPERCQQQQVGSVECCAALPWSEAMAPALLWPS